MPGCLLGQLRGCLNVVTGTRESACCMTGCTCNGGVAVTHCFFVALSGGCGCCVRCCLSHALSMCHQVSLNSYIGALPAGWLVCDTMAVRVCCVIGVTGLVLGTAVCHTMEMK